MSHRVRALTGMGQIHRIVSIYRQVWPASSGIIDLLASATECILLEDEHGLVIGYAFVEEDRERGFVELQDLAVLPKYRGEGGGTRLMEAVMGRSPVVKLIARLSNESLLAFYRKLGFKSEYIIENYYEINEDGVRMSWKK